MSSGLQNRNPRSKSRFWSCSDNQGLVANPPTRNANCSWLIRGDVQEYQRTRTELVGRRRLKLSLIESTVDWIEGSKNTETCALYARKFQHRHIVGASVSLPSQRQPPGPDSIFGIIVSRGAKFDILVRITVRSRKDLFHPLVKLLGKSCEVARGVEFGVLQLL